MGRETTVQIKAKTSIPAIPTEGPLRKAWMIKEAMEIRWEEEHRFDDLVGAHLTNLWPGMMR